MEEKKDSGEYGQLICLSFNTILVKFSKLQILSILDMVTWSYTEVSQQLLECFVPCHWGIASKNVIVMTAFANELNYCLMIEKYHATTGIRSKKSKQEYGRMHKLAYILVICHGGLFIILSIIFKTHAQIPGTMICVFNSWANTLSQVYTLMDWLITATGLIALYRRYKAHNKAVSSVTPLPQLQSTAQQRPAIVSAGASRSGPVADITRLSSSASQNRQMPRTSLITSKTRRNMSKPRELGGRLGPLCERTTIKTVVKFNFIGVLIQQGALFALVIAVLLADRTLLRNFIRPAVHTVALAGVSIMFRDHLYLFDAIKQALQSRHQTKSGQFTTGDQMASVRPTAYQVR